MRTTWTNVGDLQGQIPFSKLAYDLTGLDGNAITTPLILDGRRIEISVRGELFSIVDSIVPSTSLGVSVPVGLPIIRFNDVNSDPLELTPFAVFKVNYSKIFIDVINTVINTTYPRTYSTKSTLISSGISGVEIRNFRNNGRFKIGRQGSLAFPANTSEVLSFPVPIGAKNCKLQVTFTVTAVDMLVQFIGLSESKQDILASATHALASQIVDLEFDCSGYDHVRILMVSAVGYAGALTTYFGEFS